MARVQPLQETPQMDRLATERAITLCKNNQWSHLGWKDSFKNSTSTYIGENLAKGFISDQFSHLALMNSPTHKANIINPKFKQLGIGKACGITVELFSN